MSLSFYLTPLVISKVATLGFAKEYIGLDISRVSKKIYITKARYYIILIRYRITPYLPQR